MKEKILSKKQLIIKILYLVGILLMISGITILILKCINVISFEDGFRFNNSLFEKYTNSWYGTIIFILFQTVLTILLSVIPGTSMAFIILSTTIYPNPVQAFFLSFTSVMLSSLIMYILGRFGGYKVCTKLIGKDECDKASDLFNKYGVIYFPLMMLFPMFPDDALVMVAGTIKMRLKFFIPSIILGRGIGIVTIVFGLKIIPFESFTSIYDWLVCITVFAFWIIMVFKLAAKFNKYLENRRLRTKNKDDEDCE
ncbi:MAG: TVP38/TMEM64 family protein [Anaeroplasma sp.]